MSRIHISILVTCLFVLVLGLLYGRSDFTVAVDSEGNVYVADVGNRRIQKFK